MTVELPMPERADEPLSLVTYYNLIPVLQDDPNKPLAVVVQEDRFEEAWPLVFGDSLDDGNAQFRLESLKDSGWNLRGRNSAKVAISGNGAVVQWTLLPELAPAATLDLIPSGNHRYRIGLHTNPAQQWRAKGRSSPAAGVPLSHDAAPGLEFYLVPATKYRWLDGGELPARAYQDANELMLRKVIGGVFGYAGDKLKEEFAIPGGGAVLEFVFGLIWPAKTLDQILQEFRKDLMEDMRRLQATDALINATNKLIDVRKKYVMEYRDTKRMDIDRSDHAAALKEAALRYADDFGAAIIGLLPGVTQSDGTIVSPIPAQYHSLVRAGLAAYAQGAIDHLAAVQERALLAAFDPAYVIRAYPKSEDGKFFEAANDDVVKKTNNARNREKTMCLVTIADDTLEHGDLVALRTNNGRYLSAWTGSMGPVTAIRKTRGEWEVFRIVRVAGEGKVRDGDAIGLMGCEGVFMDGDADGKLSVYVFQLQPNSTFTIHGSGELRAGSGIQLKAPNGKFVVAKNGGGEEVTATSPNRSTWETFKVEKVSVGHTLRYGNRVVIRRPTDGRFASVTSDGTLMTNDANVTKTSVFSVEGGTAGTAVTDRFRLQTIDGTARSISIDANGKAVAAKPESWLRAEIVRGEQATLQAGEPPDWIDAFAKMYQTNLATMFLFLINRRFDNIAWTAARDAASGP
jgi:hypothetical protein